MTCFYRTSANHWIIFSVISNSKQDLGVQTWHLCLTDLYRDKASFNITRDLYFSSCKEISKVLVLLCAHSPAGP